MICSVCPRECVCVCVCVYVFVCVYVYVFVCVRMEPTKNNPIMCVWILIIRCLSTQSHNSQI